MSQLHRNKICERCRGQTTPVLGKMGNPGGKSQGSNSTQRGLHPPILVQTKLDQITNCHKQVCQPSHKPPPFGGPVSAGEQKCSRTGCKSKLSGVLQQAIVGTQTQQLVETYLGPEHLEHFPKHRVIQNGDTRDHKNLPIGRGVGYLHRFQGRILPHINSQSVQEVHAFSRTGSVLSVQRTTLWPVHSINGVYSGGQRGQTDGFTEGYKNPPVPRRPVGESHIQPILTPAYTDLGSSLSRTGLSVEQGEVRTGSKTGFQVRRLPVRPECWQALTDKIQSMLSGLVCPIRQVGSNRKASPPRVTSHETRTVAFEKELEGPRITRKGDTSPQVAPPSLKIVAG